MEIVHSKKTLLSVLTEQSLCVSKSEARRLIAQGSVKIDDVTVISGNVLVDVGSEVTVGIKKPKSVTVK